MAPKSLIKNIPSPSQQWKAPVKAWIGSLYEKKFGKVLKTQEANSLVSKSSKKAQKKPSTDYSNEELLF